MKHEITSYNTKKLLADALKTAMKDKPFSKITVSEIIARCGVNRKTFYYHFEDIFALLKWMFEEEAIEVVKHFDLLVDYKEAILFVMDYVEENDYLINCAYDSMGRNEMKRFFYADFTGIITSVADAAQMRTGGIIDPDFKEFTVKFYTEAISGMLIDWAQDKENRNREKTLRYLTRIISTLIKNLEDDMRDCAFCE